MKKNFSFTLAVKDAFNFAVTDAKTFFIPVICAVALIWLLNYAVSFFWPFKENFAQMLFFYETALSLIKGIVLAVSALTFMTIFFQKMKYKKLSAPTQKNVGGLALYGLTVYIVPVVVISGLSVLITVLMASRSINAPVALALSAVVLLISILYLVFFMLTLFAPYFYAEQKGFAEGLKKSISTVNAIIVKFFFTALLFLVVYAVIYIMPNVLGFIIRTMAMEPTPGFIRTVSFIGIALGLLLFLYLAFSSAVLTQIYIQTEEGGEGKKEESNHYEDLRKIALTSTPKNLGIEEPLNKTDVYGIIIEWAEKNIVTTLSAFKSGDSSIYLSNGGGALGGAEKEEINEASKKLVTMSQEYFKHAAKASDLSFPQNKEMKFYFLTRDGIYTAKDAMDNKNSLLMPLYMQGKTLAAGYNLK